MSSLLLACTPRRRAAAPAGLHLRASCELCLDFTDATTRFQDEAGTTPATAASDPVGRVSDKSSHARHYTQPTASKRGTVVLAAAPFNGRDVVDFTVSQGLLSPAGFHLTGPSTRVIVFRRSTTIATYGYAFTHYSGGRASGILLANSYAPLYWIAIDFAGSAGFQIDGQTIDTNVHKLSLRYDGGGQVTSSYGATLDGTTPTLSSTTAMGADANFGAINGDRGGTYGLDMRVAEYMIFSEVSASLDTAIAAHLTARYG